MTRRLTAMPAAPASVALFTGTALAAANPEWRHARVDWMRLERPTD
ncbi:MAG: hypothetical protein QOF58_7061 [Pseudonocardiales bacterium]|nr:hypothetical protein [Pseudonocardiales bacterium]